MTENQATVLACDLRDIANKITNGHYINIGNFTCHIVSDVTEALAKAQTKSPQDPIPATFNEDAKHGYNDKG